MDAYALTDGALRLPAAPKGHAALGILPGRGRAGRFPQRPEIPLEQRAPHGVPCAGREQRAHGRAGGNLRAKRHAIGAGLRAWRHQRLKPMQKRAPTACRGTRRLRFARRQRVPLRDTRRWIARLRHCWRILPRCTRPQTRPERACHLERRFAAAQGCFSFAPPGPME